MISISSIVTDIAIRRREKWVIHLFMIISRPFKHIQVSSKFFRHLSSSGDLTLHKRLVLFLHHPHLEGWQRVHHFVSSIRKRWHWSQCTSFHRRVVRISIWISTEILRGLMNIMVWRIMHIFIAFRLSLWNKSVSTMMLIWGFWSMSRIWSIWRIWFIWRIWSGVPILHGWCHDDIHLNIFKVPFGNPDFLHRGTVPAVSSNISSKYFTILIFEQFVVGVKWIIIRMRRFTCILIRLQSIYNFWLLHAILSTVLDYIGLYFSLLYYFWD